MSSITFWLCSRLDTLSYWEWKQAKSCNTFWHRYFRQRKQDWKWVHVRTINTSTPCWNGNEHIDHVHFISASIAHVKLALWQQAYLDAS